MMYIGLLWLCLGGINSWGNTELEIKIPEIFTVSPELTLQTPIRSSIDFTDISHPLINYAGVQAPDILNSCPVDSAPADLKDIINVLSGKVKGAISRMPRSGGKHCEALEKRLNEVNYKVNTALSDQIVTGGSQTQSEINKATQIASARNELVVTISNLFQAQCLSAVDDQMAVQKLFAQLASLGGILSPAAQGPLAATGGQFLGNLNLFPSDSEKALAVFRRYEEKEERAAFLCLYRQMQKTNCLLFATSEETVIGGIDVVGNSGPYFTTRTSVEKIKSEAPSAFADVVMLYDLNQNTQEFLSIMEQPDALAEGPFEGFLALRNWCFDRTFTDFQTPGYFSDVLRGNLAGIKATCSELNQFQWQEVRSTRLVSLLFNSYWQLFSLKSFYESLHFLEKTSEPDFGYIVKTWESLKYFENLVKSLDSIQNTAMGNQFRLNYHNLVTDLGNILARKSLHSLMKENRSSGKKSVEAMPRALVAELDLCQTLDPTLACLYVDRPAKNRLQRKWKKWCVGPKSRVCRRAAKMGDLSKVLVDPANRAYFESLCGFVF
ncbi:MAG: hypothetical protein ABI041_14415 [Bdellovibrionia bacterium]